MDDESFRTFAIRAEAVVNSRPITYLSSSENDLRPLTPAHFSSGTAVIDLLPRIEANALEKRYNHVTNILNQYYNRFITEYIPHLNTLNRWTKEGRDLEVGDVVCVLERGDADTWPLGRIVAVYPHADGRVRRVDVKVKDKIYPRYISSLMLLVKGKMCAFNKGEPNVEVDLCDRCSVLCKQSACARKLL